MNHYQTLLLSFLITLVAGNFSHAQLVTTVSSPKLVGQKVIIKLEIKNAFTNAMESARATAFLMDNQGKMIGQSTKWVIGGSQTNPILAAGATNTFHFVITVNKPLATTNLTATVIFNRVILAGGKLADVSKDVQIQSAQTNPESK